MVEAPVKQNRFVNAVKVNPMQTVVNLLYTKKEFPPANENMPLDPQTELFCHKETDIEIFLKTAMVTIRSLTPPFCMSTIEKHLVRMPINPKWLGYPLTNTMKANGYYPTGNYHKSPNPSRKGGVEQMWDRRCYASI
jgi:hypothetical protein